MCGTDLLGSGCRATTDWKAVAGMDTSLVFVYSSARPVILSALDSQDPLVCTHVYKVIGENTDQRAVTRVTEAMEYMREFWPDVSFS